MPRMGFLCISGLRNLTANGAAQWTATMEGDLLIFSMLLIDQLTVVGCQETELSTTASTGIRNLLNQNQQSLL